MRRFLSLGFLILFSSQAHAGLTALPTTFDKLEQPGAYSVVSGNTFSDFTYSTSPIGIPPKTGDITVREFHSIMENGLTFSGAFYTAKDPVDYTISYKVTAPQGVLLDDMVLTATWNTFGPGTGVGSITELVRDGVTGIILGSLELTSPDPGKGTLLNFAPTQSIFIQKDIFLYGGTQGQAVTVINQDVSTTTVPEPTSFAIFGIGISLIAWSTRRRSV